jgi:hypothetical protein
VSLELDLGAASDDAGRALTGLAVVFLDKGALRLELWAPFEAAGIGGEVEGGGFRSARPLSMSPSAMSNSARNAASGMTLIGSAAFGQKEFKFCMGGI